MNHTESILDLTEYNPDIYEIASELTSLACITILALATGSKTYGEKVKTLNYGRLLVIALYTFSWAFAATSVLVVSTNNNNLISCTLGMLSCDVFYAGSKIVAYAWLIERVYLVTGVKTTRLRTPQYRLHLLLLCPYVIIFTLMLSFRNIYLESNGTCTIGLKDIASIPLLIYDFILNLYLTWLFMKPLTNVGRDTRQNWKETRLYRLARRTLVASIVCLSVSFLNVLGVVITHGHQRGLVCLTLCTVDVTVNVITVHWVTNSHHQTSGQHRTKTNEDHLTADMTFESKTLEKPLQFDSPLHPEDDLSLQSTYVSYQSENPLHKSKV
ncbi:hypothetical protein BY458DRAFT_539362 [Sporodiniella umbellata]|nr:hypothetical protein BY458DRAFT_539362 [Sporodiniella umbellata]